MKTDLGHLAYCTNIHPAESWEETFAMLKESVLPVRNALQKNNTESRFKLKSSSPYAIGLRLSALAARELLTGNTLSIFKKWLSKENCYVFTINGFPYGQFHSTSVKENVYRPDWQSRERVLYTKNLFEIIGQLTPKGVSGSVSTSPASCKGFEVNFELIIDHYAEIAAHIESCSIKYDRDLHLGIEPEPYCSIETTDELLDFFKKLHTKHPSNSEIIRRRIGVNYDTCHMAIQYEDADVSLKKITKAGIRLSKIHLSNAPTLNPRNKNELKVIRDFEEPTYLHQVNAKTSSQSLLRFKDLPDALSNDAALQSEEWRVHFHIPLYTDENQHLGSTSDHLLTTLKFLKEHPGICESLEMETYTWGVMPESLADSLTSQISREYQWVLNAIG